MTRSSMAMLMVLVTTVGAACSPAQSLSESEGPVTLSEGPDASLPAPSSSAAVAASSTTTTSTTTTSTTTTTTTLGRVPVETGYGVLADADGVEIVFPAATVEMVGYHEAGHDGSKQMNVVGDIGSDSTVPVSTMETRDRGTGSRTAADIVVAPDTEIRSPVTGTVIRGGSYVLYCDHSDDFVVIEPDVQPGWEVKMFHFSGLQLAVGDRVEAGVTVVSPGAAVLPFESQVDELSADPSWPHVHVEVIDPSIPDRPSGGGGC